MLTDDAKFDDLLTKALYKAAELDAEDTPSDAELYELVQPSLRFQRKMRAMLRSPNAYARRKRRPMYIKMMRIAAVFIVALVVLGSTVIAISPVIRSTVVEFVRTWQEDRTEYYMPHRDLHKDWIFGYIPDGFELVEEINFGHQLSINYRNYSSTIINISISTGSQIIDNENSVFYNTIINGNIADIYVSNSVDHPNIIVVFQEHTGTLITLISEIDVSELIKIAENIE